jgi:uncharacterized protein (TIGR02246 family)
MRRRNVTVAVLAVLCVAVSAAARAQTASGAGPTPPPDAVAVAKTVDGFIEALDAADIEKFAELFAPDATAFFPLAPFTDRLENRAQITKVFAAFFESIRKGKSGPQYMNLVPQDARIQLYGDTAIVTFHFKGAELVSRRTLVLRRDGARWLIVHLHASGIAVEKG